MAAKRAQNGFDITGELYDNFETDSPRIRVNFINRIHDYDCIKTDLKLAKNLLRICNTCHSRVYSVYHVEANQKFQRATTSRPMTQL